MDIINERAKRLANENFEKNKRLLPVLTTNKGESMRKIGDNRYTQVIVQDEPNEKSKACHHYAVCEALQVNIAEGMEEPIGQPFCSIKFQEGPIQESGVNGIQNEDLLVIVIDRLQGFQNSDYKCRENAIALTKIEEALLWLNKRTQDRVKRNVEGTHQV